MDVANNLASWVSFGIALLALVWPIITWRKSRHLLKVSVANTYLYSAGRPLEHFVQIETINSGRDPMQITRWGITTGKGADLVFVEQLVLSSNLPANVGQNEAVHFYIRGESLESVCLEHGLHPSDMRAWVVLSNGSKQFARGTLKSVVSHTDWT
jgi:hypothetical protein